MLIVGLTGGIATGKSTVLQIFREHGIPAIDADDIARKVLEPGTTAWKEVKEYFGTMVMHANGQINRTFLGCMVFEDPDSKMKLNEITHPKIQRMMIKMAIKYFLTGHAIIVMEVPLLFETGKTSYMHKIITVSCNEQKQLERLMKRNDMPINVAMNRINNQLALEYKISRSHFVIDNSGDPVNLRTQTESIIRDLKRSNQAWYLRGLLILLFLCIIFGATFFFKEILERSPNPAPLE